MVRALDYSTWGPPVRSDFFTSFIHFVRNLLFPLLENSKSGVNDRGHRFRSGSPLRNYPHAIAALLISRFFPPKCSEASFKRAQGVDKDCLTTPPLLCCSHRLTRFHLFSQKRINKFWGEIYIQKTVSYLNLFTDFNLLHKISTFTNLVKL